MPRSAARRVTSADWRALIARDDIDVVDVCTPGDSHAEIAIAPTSSTSIIAGTTAGIDPIMKKYFLEEKKGMTVPRVAPELSMDTLWYYKNAHLIDQNWVIRAAGVRQRHIDQAQSLNLYITTDFSLRQLLLLYIRAWEEKVKTVYYVRSQALEVEVCDTCSA